MENEKRIIEGCLQNDHRSQELLYNRYAPGMFGVCLRYCDNVDDAEDVLQDAFILVFSHLKTFRSEGSFEGWIKRIIINSAINFLKKKVISLAMVPIHEEIFDATIHADILSKLSEKDLLTMIRNLPPGYRTVFNLFVIDGYSHNEIAERLGFTVSNSKTQLMRAKIALRMMLIKDGYKR
jgi:RNA polymerase sigma-70 factor (ECF subfamily)